MFSGDQSPRQEPRHEEHSKKVATLPSNIRGAPNQKLKLSNNRKYQSESCVKPGDEFHVQLESPSDADPFSTTLTVSQHKKVVGSSPSLRVKVARGHKKSHSLGSK